LIVGSTFAESTWWCSWRFCGPWYRFWWSSPSCWLPSAWPSSCYSGKR